MLVFQLLCFYVVFCANLASAAVLVNGFFHAFPIVSISQRCDILLNPLWPCLSCARINRQSFSMSGTIIGV